MKKCAVIGSKGYVGKHINWYLNHKMGISPMCYDVEEDIAENYRKVDLTIKSEINNIDLNVDYIFFFAGLTGTYAGFDMYEKYIHVNEIGLLNLLDAIRKSSYRPKIIFPSTRLVYKGTDKPLRENDEKETRTIYAVNKLASEGILQAYKESFDIPFTIFRICIPYGNLFSDNYSYGLIGFFVRMASENKDITLYGDGGVKRTFTHIEDICYQIVYASFLDESNGVIYNVGGETYSLKEAAELIASKYKTKIVSVPWPDKDLRIESNHTYFDDNKIQSLLGSLSYKSITDL